MIVRRALDGRIWVPGNADLYVCYYRVSTDGHGISGLGLEAQKASTRAYLERAAGECIGEFEEVESGRSPDRPELAKAVPLCKATSARLLVAKLDRIARDQGLFHRLRQQGVRWLAANMPEANEMTASLLIIVAEHEARLISERTKAALAAKRARGEPLGNPNLQPGTAGAAPNALAHRRASWLSGTERSPRTSSRPARRAPRPCRASLIT